MEEERIEKIDKMTERELKELVHVKDDKLRDLNRISKAFNSSLEISEVLESVVKNTADVLKCQIVSILLLDGEALKIKAAVGLDRDITDMEVDTKNTISGYVISNNTPLLVSDITEDKKFKKINHPRYLNASFISVPLRGRDRVIGVMNVNNKIDGGMFNDDELEFCEIIASHAAIALENAELYKIMLNNKLLEKEMELATAIQNSFLPDFLPRCKNLEVIARHLPARMLSGDFYNFFEMGNNKMLVAVGDVAGKGISSALFMARLISYLESQAKVVNTADGILNSMNSYLVKRSLRGMFLTIFLLIIDTKTGEVQFSNGGHLPAYIVRDGSEPIELTEGVEPPLGITEEIKYQSTSVKLETNDVMVLYTDGIIEAKNLNDEMFTRERLKNILASGASTALEAAVKVFGELFTFIGSRSLSDDTTCIMLRWKEDE